ASSCAVTVRRAPLMPPTGVRTAPQITASGTVFLLRCTSAAVERRAGTAFGEEGPERLTGVLGVEQRSAGLHRGAVRGGAGAGRRAPRRPPTGVRTAPQITASGTVFLLRCTSAAVERRAGTAFGEEGPERLTGVLGVEQRSAGLHRGAVRGGHTAVPKGAQH